MTLRETIAKNLRRLRKEHGYTQTEVANHCGLPCSVYQHYEGSDKKPPRATPSLEVMILLCDLYGLDSINDLIVVPSRTASTKSAKIFQAYIRLKQKERKVIDLILEL